MLAGCSSSSLLLPTRRLRSEALATTSTPVSTHFPMNTHRLDLPCSSSFSRKETTSNKPLGRIISLDNNKSTPIGRKTGGCSLKQNIKLPLATTRGNREEFSWNNDNNNRGKSLKRLVEDEESCLSRAKKTKCETEGGFWFEHYTGQNSSSLHYHFTHSK